MTNKIARWTLVLVAACAMTTLAGIAAPQSGTKNMTARDYEESIEKSVEKLKLTPMVPPIDIEHNLLERLKLGYFVTDLTVKAVVSAQDSYDSRVTETSPHRYADTLHLVDSLLPYTYGRPTLEAYLHGEKAHVLELTGHISTAAAEYQSQANALVSLHLAVDTERMNATVQAADLLRLSGDQKRAEPLYLDVLSYDWYKVTDRESMQDLRALYIRAGRGLIDVRRGSLSALRETYFVPATMGDLGPYLDEAITQAGGKPPVRPEPASDTIVARPRHD